MSRSGYPQAERLDLVERLHGVEVADPYRWLEDPADPRTVEWEAAQEALLAGERERWPAVGRFAERLEALMAAGEVTPPEWRGDRRFFLRRRPEQEHPVYVTVDPGGAERVLIDPMALDPEGTTTLDGATPSVEGELVAYLISVGGTEQSELYVLDVATGELVDGPITRTNYSPIAWLPGGKSFYYVRRLAPELVPADESQYHRRVLLHEVGADADTDQEIFGAGLAMTNYYWMTVPRSGKWLAVYAAAGTAPRNDVWVARLTDPATPELVPVQVGVDAQTALRFGAEGTPLAGKVLIQTDRDAPRGRICVARVDGLEYEHWRPLVAEDPESVLNDFEVLDGPDGAPLLAVSRTRHAVSELALHAVDGTRLGEVPLPGLGTIGGLTARPEGGSELWFAYSDFTTPVAVYRYDAAEAGAELPQSARVWAAAPGRIDVPKVRTRQVTYASKDGTEVRMFVMDDGTDPGPRPTILYGYGGFNSSQSPAFSARILAWVEAGGVYAVANLRGGSEEGEEWHRAGMMANKQNVYDDYHAAGDWLVAAGITTREQLGIFGGSNGGLLVGVAMTQHPEKYAAVVCWAPLLDMVRYERFVLGVTWNEEYGTAEDPEQFGWLISYSPYHHVRQGTEYPATLFTVFDGDSRVDPLHARKLAAQLQHASSGDGPILYRIEREAGHGVRAVSRTVGVYAEMWGFLAARLGLAPEG
jgi:prolyl oligopeptidase